MGTEEPFEEVADPSGLTDADWVEINKLRRAFKEGGKKALIEAMEELLQDTRRASAVIGALFPEMFREVLRDAMAEKGLTEEDVREAIRKLESPARDQ